MELVNHLLVNPTTVTHEKCTAETGEFFVYLDARQAHDGVTVRADRRSEGGSGRVGLRRLWDHTELPHVA